MLLDFQLEQIWWIVSLSAALWLRACCLYCGILKPAVQGKHFCFMRGQLEWLLWASMWKWECLLLTLLSLWHSSRWIGKLVYGYGIAHFFLIPLLIYSLLLYSLSFLCQLSWHRLCEIFRGTAGLSDEFSVWSLWSALLSASLTHSLMLYRIPPGPHCKIFMFMYYELFFSWAGRTFKLQSNQ